MFPQLIAGPIVRYQTIEKELQSRQESLGNFSAGIRRFSVGLAKKVIIADTMGAITESILSAGPAVGMIPAWLGFVAFAFQIYFDFSGYSDMAIGLGRMFGFHFLENFNYPYVSRSITEFWRRWHISLSSFFRDYLYIPLGGNRVGIFRWIGNILLVWSLTGLWHGASWNFVLWGAYYGLILLLEKLLLRRWIGGWPVALQHVYVIIIFLLGWVIFRIENFNEMGLWFLSLFGGNGAGSLQVLNGLGVLHLWPWYIIAALASIPWLPRLRQTACGRSLGGKLIKDGAVIVLFGWAIAEIVQGGFSPFIYYRF